MLSLAGESITDANTEDQPERIHLEPSEISVTGAGTRLTLQPLSLTRLCFHGE